MPEAVGLILLAPFAGEGIAGLGTIAGTTVFGVGLPTIVGGAAILGVTIGLQYALNNPQAPKPENAAQPLKQAVPPRIRGYWINRLSGYYILFLAAGGDSQDMVAFHSGRIESVQQIYLHDDAVAVIPAPSDGTTLTVQQIGAGTPQKYQTGAIHIQIFYGTDTQDASGGIISPGSTSGIWTVAFKCRGFACLGMTCTHAADAETFTKVYPKGLPLPSVVAKCAPIWDPRDVTQSLLTPSTWKASPNPVLQLIDYLTRTDGGMGLDINTILPPATLALWMTEATFCDSHGYSSAGWYQFDNSPENVIGKILSTCDGWLADAGDGTLALTVGVYRAPTDPPLTSDQILGFSVSYGMADEDTTNQLEVTYTNPSAAYVTDQIAPVQDAAAIALTGVVRSRPLDLSWVQDPTQANLLAQRALLRVNPKMSGTLVTTLYGMRYLGSRWIALQLPVIAGLENCVIEIQDKANVDALNGRVTFTWNLVDPTALLAL